MRRYVSWFAVAVATLSLALVAPSAALAALPAPGIVSPLQGVTVQATPVLQWSLVQGAAKFEVAIAPTADFTGTLTFSQTTANTSATPLKDLPVGDYYWRVRAVDRAGVAGTFSTPTAFTRALDASPLLTSPVDEATVKYPNDPLSYQWEPFAGAKTYELQVDDDAAFIGAPAAVVTPNTSYSPLNPPSFDTPVFWRVRAKSANNVYSQWSDAYTYTMTWDPTVSMTLMSPPSSNGVPIEKVVLSWAPVRGAAFYQLDLSPDQNFNAPIYDDAKVVGNTFTPKETLPAGAYYWRVRPMSTSSVPQPGKWSDIDTGAAWTFTKAWPASAPTSPRPTGTEDNRFDQVRLLAPENADFGLDQPEFSWSPQRNASHYELQIGSDSNFSPSTFLSCLTNHTRLTPFKKVLGTSTSCSTTYISPGVVRYWRVRAVDADSGVLGAFSEVRSYLYDPTHLVQTSPTSGSAVTTPVLRWNPVSNISRYKVTLDDTSGASGCTQTVTATVWGTTYVPETLKRTCAGPWAWTVQGIDDDNSLTRLQSQDDWPTFTTLAETTIATAPDPVVQTAGAAYRPPLLDWPGVSGADGYQVYFSVADANSFTPASVKTNQTAWEYTGVPPSGSAFGELLPPGDYDYYVRAFSAATALTSSPVGHFHIGPMPVTTLTSPDNCPLGSCSAAEYDTPTFRWNPVDGAGLYRIYLATDPLFTNITRTYDTQFTSVTPSESLPDSQAGQATYWFVRPCYTASNCGPFDESVFGQARAFRKQTRAVETLGAMLPTPSTAGAPVDNSVVFTWNDYLATNRDPQIAPTTPVVDLEAASYQLQVSTTSNFTTIIDNVTGIDQTTYVSPTVTYADGPLYARVRAIDNTGNPMTWSEPFITITKSTPSPSGLLPTGGASVTGTPLLQWTPMASALQYDVEVYKNPDAPVSPTNLVATVKTRLTTGSLAAALPAGQDYGWRVRRLDANAKASSWSTLARFTVTGPAPVLTAPANGSAINSNSLLFTWATQARATRYAIEASTVTSFATKIETASTDMTSWAPSLLSPAWPNGTIYWRVSALDTNNAVLGTSPTWSIARDAGTAGEFSAVTPYRVLDTRKVGGMIGAGQTRTVGLTGGSSGIPSTGISAVVLNLTVTGATKASYLTLWAAGPSRPPVTTIIFAAGQTLANHATVQVSAAGKASYYNAAGSTHVVIDVVGYYSGGTLSRASRYTAATVPARILDTRGVGGASPRPLFSGESRLVEVAGLGGVPLNATAVVMNLTAVKPTKAGYLGLYPAGAARPTASSLNFPAGANVPNLVTMPLGSGGDMRVYNSAGTTHVLVDIVGWYTPGDPSVGSRFNPLTPARIVNTQTTSAPALGSGQTRSFAVRGMGGVPNTSQVKAVVLTVTVTKPVSAGYLTVFASGTSRPATSNLNYALGQTVSNQVIARVGVDGKVAVYAYKGTHVVIEVVGWMG